MNDSSIKNEYIKKIKLLHKYNKAYFDQNKSLITDQEFDILKNQIHLGLLFLIDYQGMEENY